MTKRGGRVRQNQVSPSTKATQSGELHFPKNDPLALDNTRNIAISGIRHSEQRFSGPIPPPFILKEYNDLVPGAAKQILDQAQQQTTHRIDLEKKVIDSDIRRSWAGLIVAGAISSVTILGGMLLVGLGHDTAGATIATGSVTALAGVFVYGTNMRKKERTEKAAMMVSTSRDEENKS